MPRVSTERRKSSFGTRRGPPKRHIPFRADDLAHGKKTGMAVGFVDRNSDDIEPFDLVIGQADNQTPTRVKPKKKRVSVAPPLPDLDEDGEMSMELAESNQGSPLRYLTNPNAAYTLENSRRPIVSRSFAPASEFDYDQIPSPNSHAPLRSTMNGRGSSALSRSILAQEPTPEPDFDDAPMGVMDDFEPPQPDESPPRSRSPLVSPEIEELNAEPEGEEEEEAAEVEQAVVARSEKIDKGKRRADPVREDEDPDPDPHDANRVEDDIVWGLEEVNNAPDDEDNPPPTKKPRKEPVKARKPRPEKRLIQAPVERSPTPEGLRRGRRHRFKPLQWWRQEKVTYGDHDPNVQYLVPHIKEVVRIPQEPVKPLGKAGKRKRGTSVRAKSKGRDTPFNPEDGWDDETPTNANVIDFDSQEEVSRRVAFLPRMIDLKQAANSNWLFQKIFGEGDFVAAGQMRIPPKAQKPSKSTKDNTYVFYVIQGAVSVFIHETSFIITTGGMFLVPRGNTYCIENIAERDAKLFFTQARLLHPEDIGLAQHTARSAPPSQRRAISEGSSTGPKKGKGKA